jgi:predicted nucleic acid-binding protein
MIVVADTSPLNYLVLIDEINPFTRYFRAGPSPSGSISRVGASQNLSEGASMGSRSSSVAGGTHCGFSGDAGLLRLDPGEREAIQLALELGVRTVLIDEADGRQQAEKLHLEVRGTLGILEHAAKLGKINFRQALKKLEQTNFRVSPVVRTAFLKRNV